MTKKEKFLKTLKNLEGDVVICGHVNPDFDSISSMMLIEEYIIKECIKDTDNETSLIFNEKDIETNDFIYFKETYNKGKNEGRFYHEFEVDYPSETTLIMVDICSNEKRLPEFVADNINSFKNVIVIDHHKKDESIISEIKKHHKDAMFFINPEEQSCAEYIYSMLPVSYRDVDNFKELYTFGILGDSGNMKFSQPKFELDKNIQTKLDNEWFTLTDTESIALAKLTYTISKQGYAYVSLDESDMYPNVGKLACYLSVALDDMAFDLIKEDEEGFYRHSLRACANCDIDVSKIANTVGGGGHVKASGARTLTPEPLIKL